MSHSRGPETPWERTVRKFTNEPLVPIGALLTAGCLIAGLKAFKDGNPVKGQNMMRGRVVMQAFTVMMMSLGSVYGMQSSKKAPQVSNNNSSVSVNAASDVSQSS